MLQSKQYSEFWYFLDFHVFSSLSDVVRKCLKEVVFLVVPEDTTDNVAGRDKRGIGVEASNARSIGKVTFWIVIAIILSLSIGQLR
jgi:hypothetical protein